MVSGRSPGGVPWRWRGGRGAVRSKAARLGAARPWCFCYADWVVLPAAEDAAEDFVGCRRAVRYATATAVSPVAVVPVAGVAVVPGVAVVVAGVALALEVGGVLTAAVADCHPPVLGAAVAVVANELFLRHDGVAAVAAGAHLALLAAAVVVVTCLGFAGSRDGECECGAQKCD